MAGPWCAACGELGIAGEGDHERCARALELDTPRFCTRCGRRLDVQVYPTGFSATCRRCDGVHPRDRGRSQGGNVTD